MTNLHFFFRGGRNIEMVLHEVITMLTTIIIITQYGGSSFVLYYFILRLIFVPNRLEQSIFREAFLESVTSV